MDPQSSGGIPSTQLGPQQLQLLADAGMSPSKSDLLKSFYKGEPLALGITQILIGILEVAFGIINECVDVLYMPPYMQVRTQDWTGLLFIISGSLSVAASKNPRIALVKGMLAMNVVSAVGAGVGLLLFAVSFDEFLPADGDCLDLDPEASQICYELHVLPWIVVVYQNTAQDNTVNFSPAGRDVES